MKAQLLTSTALLASISPVWAHTDEVLGVHVHSEFWVALGVAVVALTVGAIRLFKNKD